MAKIVVDCPDEVQALVVEAFWALYGSGESTAEERIAFAGATIRGMVAEQVAKYVRERDAQAALVAATVAGRMAMEHAESAIAISLE